MNPPRQKGTRAESAVKRWLCDELGISVDRSPLRGNKDCGDILGLPDTVVEVKNCKLPSPKQWAKELFAEMGNAGTSQGVVLWSPPGVGMARVDEWVALATEPTHGRPVPQFGALNVLHRYVSLMGAHGFSVTVNGLDASTAGAWLGSWRECNLHRLVAR